MYTTPSLPAVDAIYAPAVRVRARARARSAGAGPIESGHHDLPTHARSPARPPARPPARSASLGS